MHAIDIAKISPQRILLAGDWHRHVGARHAIKVVQFAKENDIDTIVQLGDFGYRFGKNGDDGYRFEKPLQIALAANNVNLVWIDGNHDNHRLLHDLPRLANGFVKTGSSGRIFYAPRGHRWTWRDRTFGALGGAWSVNWRHLTEGVDLFSLLEETSDEDLASLGAGPLDYLLCHDVPKRVAMKSILGEVLTENTRKILQQAVDTTKPLRVFSGHWHQRKDYRIPRKDGLESFGHLLNMEYFDDNIAILDLETNQVENPPLRWNAP